MASDNNANYLSRLLEQVRGALEADEALRKKYFVGQKFCFVSDQLKTLLKNLEKKVAVEEKAQVVATQAQESYTTVYVYLYNAKGMTLSHWQNMLTPKVFYEYSVNRPIYASKEHIENLLRSKPNKMQHAYLTIFVKPEDVVKLRNGEEYRKDILGNPLIRVKEGSLRFQNLVQFTHNEQDFVVNVSGELVKK